MGELPSSCRRGPASTTWAAAGWLLLIDTCGEVGGVGLAYVPPAGQGKASLRASRTVPGRQTQEQLLPAIAGLMHECELQSRELGAVGVVTGPGSFTGVRVGVAAAKGLAEALQLPLVGISRLAVLAAQAGTPRAEAWLQAGRGDVFRGRYQQGQCTDEAMLRPADAVAELSGEGAVVMEAELLAVSPQVRLVAPVGLAEALPLFAEQVWNGAVTDAALLQANYLRVPDAELARRARASMPPQTL